MATHERSRETSAQPGRIWTIWSDTSTWPRWNPGVKDITLNGPFETGTTGSMTTTRGENKIQLDDVIPGRSFDLVTSPLPATTFRFHCEVVPSSEGSRISQGVTMGGVLGPVFSALMGNRVAAEFDPILAGLASEAENEPATT